MKKLIQFWKNLFHECKWKFEANYPGKVMVFKCECGNVGLIEENGGGIYIFKEKPVKTQP